MRQSAWALSCSFSIFCLECVQMPNGKNSRIAVRNVEIDSSAGARVRDYADDEIGPGKRVVLHFALLLVNAQPVDSNFDKEPVSFTIGDGNLLPGFENALMG